MVRGLARQAADQRPGLAWLGLVRLGTFGSGTDLWCGLTRHAVVERGKAWDGLVGQGSPICRCLARHGLPWLGRASQGAPRTLAARLGVAWCGPERSGLVRRRKDSGQPAQGGPRRGWVCSGEVRLARCAGSAQADRPIPGGALRQASMVRLGKARLGTVWTGLVGYGQAGCGAARILAPAWPGRARRSLAGSGVARPGKDGGQGKACPDGARTGGPDTRAR